MENGLLSSYGDIIFIALVAAYIVYRLGSVLGRKEDEADIQETLKRYGNASATEPSMPEAAEERYVEPQITTKEMLEEDLEKYDFESDEVKAGIRDITARDRTFSLTSFFEGAKAAFDMVLKAFSERDKDMLKTLLSDKLYKVINSQITDNDKKDLTATKTLVSVKVDKVLSAVLEGSKAKLRLRFITEQIEFIKDKDGKVVDGDPSFIETVEDEWEFERNVNSGNPNWKIVAI
jgi:predicted lipid-binding transport protein (Tim44 family)